MANTPDPKAWENAQVECVKDLPSYKGRTGIVNSVIPRGGYLDIGVDFGRGLETVVMTENDLRLITKLNDQAPTATQ